MPDEHRFIEMGDRGEDRALAPPPGSASPPRRRSRGSGSSERGAEDEHTDRELRDHVTTIAWLATQDWSKGHVGMYGTSCSGFNLVFEGDERIAELRWGKTTPRDLQ
jgi:hypothetical protein